MAPRIVMSREQLEEMQKATQLDVKNRYRNEKVWTLLLADVLVNPDTRQAAIEKMCGCAMPWAPSSDVWFEAQPLSPRKGKSGSTEGNTRLDLAFGHVRQRGKTTSGIEFGPSAPGSWVCFVEAKCLSDCSSDVSHDPFRNQLTRVIENLLCFGDRNGRPDTCYFTLVTPRRFKPSNDDGQYSRLYGYKMREYEDRDRLLHDVMRCEFRARDTSIDFKSDEFKRRLQPDRLVLTWVEFESVLGSQSGVGAPVNLDVLAKEWDPGPRALEVVNRLQMESETLSQ